MTGAAYPPIADYGLIGNCRTAALVSRNGSIDWWCVPRFDSPAVFAALLDRARGGAFAIHPAGEYRATRRYVEDTNVLETTFETADGRVKLLDLMPVRAEAEKRSELIPDHQILRLVEGEAGEVELEVRCAPRAGYGRTIPDLSDRGPLGFCWTHGARALYLRSEIPLRAGPDPGTVSGRGRVAAGERRALSLTATDDGLAVVVPLGRAATEAVQRTADWWRGWAGRARYDGPARAQVVRNALVLKLLTYAPSGAVIAAPTTSLPENPGGIRNWDYRYCWLRDASLTLQALADLGYSDEAESFLAWMTQSTRLTWPELNPLYDVYGETRIPERELEWLEGYAGSRPVRIGNAAKDQLQLDVYGEVADAAFEWSRREGEIDVPAGRLLAGLAKTVSRRWQEPDEGIWEIRGGRRHHTYSKVMCWVTLDRVLKLHEAGAIPGSEAVSAFREHRERIREQVERDGFNEELGSYVSVLGGNELDASLLLLGRHGFADPKSPRMRGTCEAILDRLGRNGLLYRYLGEDGLPGGEGAFGICSFWAVDCLCREGRLDEAWERFDRVCGYGNDLGLFAEEYDPGTGAALGNFPQGFTHVGLIDAALSIEEHAGRTTGPARRKDRREDPGR